MRDADLVLFTSAILQIWIYVLGQKNAGNVPHSWLASNQIDSICLLFCLICSCSCPENYIIIERASSPCHKPLKLYPQRQS
jgi:hypothetical protein